MEAPVTIRLDSKTRRKIARIAERRRISKSEVIRQALNSLPEFTETEKSAYEAVKDLIGVLNSGDPKFSEDTGRKFREILQRKRNRS